MTQGVVVRIRGILMPLVLAWLSLVPATGALAQVDSNGTAVINEIHFNPRLSTSPSEFINVRGFVDLVSVTTQIAPSHVICQDE